MKFGRAILVFTLCICAAFTCALTFAILAVSNLPPGDWAYDYSIARKLSDPFLYNGIIDGGIFFGLISFPFVYFTTRNRQLKSTAPAIFGIVIGEIILITPIARMANLFGAPVALAAALLMCNAGVFDRPKMSKGSN
jgi:hypothetical protein